MLDCLIQLLYQEASALQLPGLATINGPLIVGGTAIDGIMGPVFPKTATVNIIPTLNAPGTALKISALGDGITPFPGIGLQCSAINHNLIATTLISVTTPLFAITAPVTTKLDCLLNLEQVLLLD